MSDRMNLITVRDALASLPITVSERRFRETARSLGVNVLDGRQMLVRSQDVEAVLRAMTPCLKSQNEPAHRTGKSTGRLQVNASAKALALLTERPRKPQRATSKAD